MTRADQRFWLLLCAFAALCAPLIFSNGPSNYSMDEAAFHLPAVRQIRSHWPKLDLEHDALSAISPFYHYVLASSAMLVGTAKPVLRTLNWAVSAGVLLLLWRYTRALLPEPALWIAPLAASNFFVKSACWVVTDNAGLLAAAAVLCTALWRAEVGSSARVGALSAIATAVRQLHFWTAATTFAVAVVRQPRSYARCLYVLLPTAVLSILVWRWHGLVPPHWQEAVKVPGISLAAVAYALAVLFVLGIFYWAAAGEIAVRLLFDRWSAAGVLIGLLCAIQSPTTFDMAQGRWGGYFWNVAAHVSAWYGRSVVFLLLAPLGGALAVNLTRTLIERRGAGIAVVWGTSLAAWFSTFLANRQAFHRYFEPTLLVFLIIWAALVFRPGPQQRRGSPLVWLASAQLIVTLATAHWQTLWQVARIQPGP